MPNGKNREISFAGLVMLIVFLFVFLINSAVGIIFYHSVITSCDQKLQEISRSCFTQFFHKVENKYKSVVNMADTLFNHQELRQQIEQLIGTDLTMYQKMQIRWNLENLISKVSGREKSMASVTLLIEDELIEVGKNTKDVGRQISELKMQANDIALESEASGKIPRFIRNADSQVLSLIYTESIAECAVIWRMDISENWLKDIAEDGGAIIFDQDSVLLNHTSLDDCKLIGSASAGDALYSSKLHEGQIHVLYEKKPARFEEGFKHTRINLYVFLLLDLFVVIIFLGVGLKRFLQPLQNIVSIADHYKVTDMSGNRFQPVRSKLPVRKVLLYNFLIIIVVPLCVFIIMYYINTRNALSNTLVLLRNERIESTAEDITAHIISREELIRQIALDETVQQALISDEVETQPLTEALETILRVDGLSDHVRIYKSDGTLLLTSSLIYHERNDEEVLQALQTKIVGFVYSGLTGTNASRQEYRMGFVVRSTGLSAAYKHMESTRIGYIILSIPEEELLDICNSAAIISDVNIWLSKDNIQSDLELYNSNASVLPATNIVYKNCAPGLMLCCTYNNQDIINQINDVFKEKLYLIVILVLVIFLVSYQLSEFLANPLTGMAQVMYGMKPMDFQYVFPTHGPVSEINQLGEAFNNMLERTEKLMDELLATQMAGDLLKAKQRKLELISLQSQIKPHFLCNTLASINCLIEENKQQEASAMLGYLSNFFRYSISQHELTVDIEQELAYTKAYASIMKYRYGSRVQFEWQVEGDLHNVKTLKMLFQPFLENSISHGLTSTQNQIHIITYIGVKQNNLVIRISDDGCGMSPQRLEDVLTATDDTVGTAIRNVRSRLQLYYGEMVEFFIESSLNQGTSVNIIINLQ